MGSAIGSRTHVDDDLQRPKFRRRTPEFTPLVGLICAPARHDYAVCMIFMRVGVAALAPMGLVIVACGAGSASEAPSSTGDASVSEAAADAAGDRAAGDASEGAFDAATTGDAYAIGSCDELQATGSSVPVTYTADPPPEMTGGTPRAGHYELASLIYYGGPAGPSSLAKATVYVEIGRVMSDAVEGRWYEVYPPGNPNSLFREGYGFRAERASAELTFERMCENHPPQADFSQLAQQYSVLTNPDRIAVMRPNTIYGEGVWTFARK
jgi:hypothetical protein